MGKRQVRIFRRDILSKKTEIIGQEGHVILADHVVHSGQILEITEAHLVVLDPRRHKHILNLATIQEVVFDKETDY